MKSQEVQTLIGQRFLAKSKSDGECVFNLHELFMLCLYNHMMCWGYFFCAFSNQMPAIVQWQEMSMQVVPWVVLNSEEGL